MSSGAVYAGIDIGTSGSSSIVVFLHVGSHFVTSVTPCKSGGCFHERTTFIMSVVVFFLIHFVILEEKCYVCALVYLLI